MFISPVRGEYTKKSNFGTHYGKRNKKGSHIWCTAPYLLSPDTHWNCLLLATEPAWPPQWVRRPCLRRAEYHIKSGKELSPRPPAADPVGVRGKTTTCPAVQLFQISFINCWVEC